MAVTALTGTVLEPGERLSVAAYLGEWLAHARGRVRRVTFEGYEALLRRHVLPRLGELELSAVTPLLLQRLYADLSREQPGQRALAAGTVLNLHLVLTQALAQAVRWQLLPANPACGAQPPRPRRAARVVVDPALAEQLLAATAGTSWELPCALALATGLRRGELLALRWSDLSDDLSQAQVVRTLQPTQQGLLFEQPKTARSRRLLLLPTFVRPYLERHQARQQTQRATAGSGWQEHGLLFTRKDGRPRNPDTVSTTWAGFLRRRRLPPVRFHDLRHAHATLLLLQGVHPKIVSERLGHASVAITLDTYSHVLPSMQTQAADAIDALFPRRKP